MWFPSSLLSQPSAHALVSIPGSKSLTARALVLARLSTSESVIENILIARDSTLMIEALRATGACIDVDGTRAHITPRPIQAARIQVGLAGTLMRFLPPLLCLAPEVSALYGDEQAARRPIQPLLNALESLGMRAEHPEGASLPLTIIPPHSLSSTCMPHVKVNAEKSSQFLSALLLAAPAFPAGLRVSHIGKRLPSLPHVHMTLGCLAHAGVQVEQEEEFTWAIAHQNIRMPHAVIEPDAANATPFLAGAFLLGTGMRIPHIPRNSLQPIDEVVALWHHAGAAISHESDSIVLHPHSQGSRIGRFDGFDWDCEKIGELVPTICALAACARTPSRLRNISQLRGHETDRLTALITELAKVGIHARTDGTNLEIIPPDKPQYGKKTTFDSYHDHRMVTFAAILALAYPHICIEGEEATQKTFPQFVPMWEAWVSGTNNISFTIES